MNKNIFFIVALIIPIILIGIGIYTKDIEQIEKSFFLLLSFCGAYVASIYKDIRNIKISYAEKKTFILLFSISVLVIIFSFFYNFLYLGCVLASMLGLYPFYSICKKK